MCKFCQCYMTSENLVDDTHVQSAGHKTRTKIFYQLDLLLGPSVERHWGIYVPKMASVDKAATHNPTLRGRLTTPF